MIQDYLGFVDSIVESVANELQFECEIHGMSLREIVLIVIAYIHLHEKRIQAHREHKHDNS